MKLFIFCLTLFFTVISFAQNKVSESGKKQTSASTNIIASDKDIMVYKNALSLGDLETATYALHNIIADNPNGGKYKDTLAMAYLQRGYYRQAQLLTKALYQEKENDTRTEVLAICAKQLGQPTEAIDLYKKLYKVSKNNNYAFEQLQLEYSIKRLAEAKLTAEALLLTLPSEDKTKLMVPQLDNKTTQEVSLKAGVYYLLGKIHADLNYNKSALDAFQNAIRQNPEYEMAINAYEELLKKK